MLRKIVFIIFCFGYFAEAYSSFCDMMKCNNKMIEYGYDINLIKSLCGSPIYEKEVGIYSLVSYPGGGQSAKYFLLFENSKLLKCALQIYNTDKYNWMHPDDIKGAPKYGNHEVEQQGCCSSHQGVCGCKDGQIVCCDREFSPSCICRE